MLGKPDQQVLVNRQRSWYHREKLLWVGVVGVCFYSAWELSCCQPYFSSLACLLRPTLIIVSGLPGSGKSTVAQSLAEETLFPIFSVDPIEAALIKSGLKRSFETGLAAYLVAETLADEQLKHGLSVIIDAVSPVQEARDMWNSLAHKHNAMLIIIECVLDRELHKQRIESRIRNMYGIPEVTWEDVENRRKEYLLWTEERLVLNTAHIHEESVKKALEYIYLKGGTEEGKIST